MCLLPDVVKDCLALQFDSCYEQAISISFWIRLRNTRQVLATGSYIASNNGPGVLIEYNPQTEILQVEVGNSKRLWKTSLLVRKHAWCHLSVVWSIESGLRIILNGKSEETVLSTDRIGKSHRIKMLGMRYVTTSIF